jgi:hypothetical protein
MGLPGQRARSLGRWRRHHPRSKIGSPCLSRRRAWSGRCDSTARGRAGGCGGEARNRLVVVGVGDVGGPSDLAAAAFEDQAPTPGAAIGCQVAWRHASMTRGALNEEADVREPEK